MKSFLIKLGKVFNLIKNEGFCRGLNKSFKYLLVFLNSLFVSRKEGDVLFISSGVGDSARYRCYHVAEELSLNNFKCLVTVQDNPLLPCLINNFKIFIFHKTLFTPRMEKIIQKIKEQKKEIIFDADDLLFDPQFIQKTDYYRKINKLEKYLYLKGLGGEFVDDNYVKACTTTTSYLADKLREYGKKVFVVPNKLSNEDLEIVNNLTDNQRPTTNNKVRIGYFSGTKSHDRDFATIVEPLTKIMEKYPKVGLFLFGPLDVGEKFSQFGNRVQQFPYVPRQKHFANIASIDINLAPLEIDNPFCESKSELKFFEAGILKVPTVAAATQTFREAIEDGVDGFTAATEEEWYEKLEKLIVNADLRLRLGQKAYEKTLKEYTTQNSHNEEYYNYLRNHITQNI